MQVKSNCIIGILMNQKIVFKSKFLNEEFDVDYKLNRDSDLQLSCKINFKRKSINLAIKFSNRFNLLEAVFYFYAFFNLGFLTFAIHNNTQQIKFKTR